MHETQFGSCGAGKPRTFPLKRLNSQPRRRRSVSAFGNSVLREGKGALERRQGPAARWVGRNRAHGAAACGPALCLPGSDRLSLPHVGRLLEQTVVDLTQPISILHHTISRHLPVTFCHPPKLISDRPLCLG